VNGQLPELDEAVLIVMLTGWIDASGAASAAMEYLVESSNAEVLIDFDPDTFMDFRARRPVMELREGVNTAIVWNTPQLKIGSDKSGTKFLMLTGPEPDTSWNAFASAVAGIAKQLNVTKAIGMGAYPFGAPHTRPVGLTATSPDPAIIERLTLSKNSLDVPAGIEPVIEHSLHQVGIASLCIWAQVPHYVASMAYPAATAALLEAVAVETGLSIDAVRFHRESGVQRERLDQLVSNNPEHMDMLNKLEVAYDEMHAGETPIGVTNMDIPTVDEIAAEVEQFLRDQQPGG
jgi:predicted ATP-grasp superfamily ATP-dependent carboligase